MGDLFRMELYKLRKNKFFWGTCIACFAVTFVMPILGKLFSNLLLNILNNTGETDEAIMQAKELVYEFGSPYSFSLLFKAPFGGLSIVLIVVFLSAASFLHLDIGNGYIKNIAGQIATRGHSCYGKYFAVCLMTLIYMLCGFAGSLTGTLIARGVKFDSEIGAGILEFFLKWLLLCGLHAVLLFFTTGLGNKVLGIVAGVVFATGALSVIYYPLSYGLNMLFRRDDISIGDYAPDQMISHVNISVPAALICGVLLVAVFLPLTIRLLNRRDVK